MAASSSSASAVPPGRTQAGPFHASAPRPTSTPGGPMGTFAAGTKIQVGTHRVVIDRYLSEGGFAHVYLVKLPRPVDGHEIAVLKRVAVPDKEALANMRTEVETMKKLQGHKYIVKYMDSHASQLRGGGYEVFLLMEYCAGGGLIDFMNTRLQNRLTEPEILHIFSDVAEGVACMHYLKPPLLHRDLKVENVLISAAGNFRRYKLCDFGSAAPPRPAATSAGECRLIEDDVQKHTTLQYRSPEMIDVYRKQPIDEKSDIWALGVLLYKLCYYTTPFEEQGQLAILNASFKYPSYPTFSDRAKKLIAMMLQEKPQTRPNIYQVLREVCSMRGTPCPVKDIYAGRSQSEARKNQQLPSPEPSVKSPPLVGAVQAAPERQQQVIPQVAPMRRGRPTSSTPKKAGSQRDPSPGRGASGDPFAALDIKSAKQKDKEADELSSRFPTLDQFSLIVDSGSKFDFQPAPAESAPENRDLNQRVTERLADEAFARTSPKPHTSQVQKRVSEDTKRPISSQSPLLHQPSPQRPPMVSQGTMTSPPSSPPPLEKKPSKSYRFPRPSLHTRSSSQPRPAPVQASESAPAVNLPPEQPKRPSLLSSNRSRSHFLASPGSPASSRPSLEGNRPTSLDLEPSMTRSRSANSKTRPTSSHLASDLDYLRDREEAPVDGKRLSKTRTDSGRISGVEGSSSVDFLRAMEEDEAGKKREKRLSSGGAAKLEKRLSSGGGSKHGKKSSLSSLSLSNPKSLFAGRFGDAFRRFEGHGGEGPEEAVAIADDAGPELTPITGSEVTGDRSDDGDDGAEAEEELSPETRRELERQRLIREERRVEAAAAAYRQKREAQGGRPSQGPFPGVQPPHSLPNRAKTIQNKVRNMLDESRPADSPALAVDTQGLPSETVDSTPVAGVRSLVSKAEGSTGGGTGTGGGGRPAAPPKPTKLRGGGPGSGGPSGGGRQGSMANGAGADSGTGEGTDDWEQSFSRRFPSLSGLEMVETVIDKR